MATSLISNTVRDAAGNVVANVPVSVTLMPSAGFRISDFTEVARVATATTNSSGFWSLALEQNSNITPGNSWYEVTESIPDANGGKRTWFIAVGASDQTLLASLVTPAEQQPTVVPAGTVYLDQPTADARYQALGSLGSATPVAETPDVAGAAGVLTSASRSDHVHGAATATPVAIGTTLTKGSSTSFARADHVHNGAALGTVPNGYQPAVANQTGITAEVDLTSLTVTFTAVAGRRYRITGQCRAQSTVADDTFRLSIKEGATSLQLIDTIMRPINTDVTVHGSVIIIPTAGAHTYKLTGARGNGTGTHQMSAGSVAPAFILVEDIGV